MLRGVDGLESGRILSSKYLNLETAKEGDVSKFRKLKFKCARNAVVFIEMLKPGVAAPPPQKVLQSQRIEAPQCGGQSMR